MFSGVQNTVKSNAFKCENEMHVYLNFNEKRVCTHRAARAGKKWNTSRTVENGRKVSYFFREKWQNAPSRTR